ncbi:MAG TPA: hypothetical protein ENH08_01040, partial [Chromatiales bacterium]|nr:hypothetical protein [Chromatiales bacterium]
MTVSLQRNLQPHDRQPCHSFRRGTGPPRRAVSRAPVTTLLTGASGFVGSAVLRRLIGAGH